MSYFSGIALLMSTFIYYMENFIWQYHYVRQLLLVLKSFGRPCYQQKKIFWKTHFLTSRKGRAIKSVFDLKRALRMTSPVQLSLITKCVNFSYWGVIINYNYIEWWSTCYDYKRKIIFLFVFKYLTEKKMKWNEMRQNKIIIPLYVLV